MYSPSSTSLSFTSSYYPTISSSFSSGDKARSNLTKFISSNTIWNDNQFERNNPSNITRQEYVSKIDIYNHYFSENILLTMENLININPDHFKTHSYSNQIHMIIDIQYILHTLYKNTFYRDSFVVDILSKISRVFDMNLSYIKHQNLIYKFVFILYRYGLLVSDDNQELNRLQKLLHEKYDHLLFIYLDDFDFRVQDSGNHDRTILHHLFNKINEKETYRLNLLKFLTKNSLLKSDYFIILDRNNYTSLLLLFLQIKNKLQIDIITFLIKKSLINKNYLALNPTTNRQTIWHHLLMNIQTELQFDLIRFLLVNSFLDYDYLLIKDIHNRTCFHYLLNYIDNKYKLMAIKLLLPFVNSSDFIVTDNSNNIVTNYYEKYMNHSQLKEIFSYL